MKLQYVAKDAPGRPAFEEQIFCMMVLITGANKSISISELKKSLMAHLSFSELDRFSLDMDIVKNIQNQPFVFYHQGNSLALSHTGQGYYYGYQMFKPYAALREELGIKESRKKRTAEEDFKKILPLIKLRDYIRGEPSGQGKIDQYTMLESLIKVFGSEHGISARKLYGLYNSQRTLKMKVLDYNISQISGSGRGFFICALYGKPTHRQRYIQQLRNDLVFSEFQIIRTPQDLVHYLSEKNYSIIIDVDQKDMESNEEWPMLLSLLSKNPADYRRKIILLKAQSKTIPDYIQQCSFIIHL
jgi:hypothetical protein